MNTKQVYNPFLPLNEYISDGEPHVFGDRVYLFGSHDKEGGSTFCMLDYVVYSAPINDLTDWTNEGVIYSAKHNPLYSKERCYIYAPDVVCGNDGKYYLYYCLAGKAGANGYTNPVSVAVCDTPAGKYKYLGCVKDENGVPYTEHPMFDPALINDNGVIRLYSGTRFTIHEMDIPKEKVPEVNENLRKVFQRNDVNTENVGELYGAYTCTLADDMLTINSDMVRITPVYSKGTSWEKHPFFEASSIRKINGRYYYIYSSAEMHELCYAVSDIPDKDFVCKGTIISNGDIGFEGRKKENSLCLTGNNHGSIENISGQWYVFYHRHTHLSSYSRQACAEKITMSNDGTIPQVRITSCGLNNGPLCAKGIYPAAIACVLTNGNMPMAGNESMKEKLPQITHNKTERYIAYISENTTFGFRSFKFESDSIICLQVSGTANGILYVSDDQGEIGRIKVDIDCLSWSSIYMPCTLYGEHSLYFTYHGAGRFDLLNICFEGD